MSPCSRSLSRHSDLLHHGRAAPRRGHGANHYRYRQRAAAVSHPPHHHRPLHRLARFARARRRLRRCGEPVRGRHEIHLRCRALPVVIAPSLNRADCMSRPPSQAPAEARLPVAVITGFLGSGKTTLVRHILANQQGLRTSVIVNELSELGIDGELIVSADGDMVELENGCICCSMNNDFVDAIFRVLNRGRRLDYLVVETSGVSDPLPVVLTFLRSELRDRVRVDSIITVADVADFCLDRFESKAASNQLCHGDVVLLNKCDLAGADALRTVETAIRGINPQARMVRTTQCRSRSLSSSVSDCSSRTAFS